MTLRKRRVLLIISVIIFAIASVVIDFYANGYRLDSKFRLIKTGGIYVYSPRANSDIYINNKFKKQSGIFQNGVFLQNLKPGKYSVIVSKDGYWPWQKKIDVKAERVTEIRAMLVSKNPQGKVILKGPFSNMYYDSELKILILVENNKKTDLKKISFYLPNENSFLTPSSNQINKYFAFKEIKGLKKENGQLIILTDKGEIKAEIKNNQTFSLSILKNQNNKNTNEKKETIFISEEKNIFNPYLARLSSRKNELVMTSTKSNTIWFDIAKDTATLPYFLFETKNLSFPVKIFDSKFKIKNIDFFPTRRDVIIVAIRDGVFAMELDGRGGRLIQPIYKGKDPTFAVFTGEKKIYVLDDGNLSYIKLE